MAYKDIVSKYILIFLAVFIVLCNAIKIYFCIKQIVKKKSMALVYVTNLALSDLHVGIFMIILKTLDQFVEPGLHGALSEIYNVVRFGCLRFALFVSIFNLIAITINQLCAVYSPLTHRRLKVQIAYKICIFTWLFSLAIISSLYITARFTTGDFQEYSDLVFSITTYPAAIMYVACYTIIFKTLFKAKIISHPITNNFELEMNLNKKESTRRKELRFSKFAVKNVVAFIVCWLPYSTFRLMVAIDRSYNNIDIDVTLFTIAFCSSLVNPFLYFDYVSLKRQNNI